MEACHEPCGPGVHLLSWRALAPLPTVSTMTVLASDGALSPVSAPGVTRGLASSALSC